MYTGQEYSGENAGPKIDVKAKAQEKNYAGNAGD